MMVFAHAIQSVNDQLVDRSWRWRAICGGGLLVLAMLQACGGGTSGDAESPPPQQQMAELSGRVSDGVMETDVRSLQVTVKGNVGTARTAEGRLTSINGSDYLASLDQLSGPYLLSNAAASSTFGLYSVATGGGTANLTPLTTLLVAELLGEEPGAYFASQGVRGGFTAADDTSIAVAQQRVRRYLRREFGFDVPASLGDFVTTRFDRTAGDPMFDTITALVAQIGNGGDYSAVVSALAQESARCKQERATIQRDSETDDFCPYSKRNEPDPADATVQVLRFDNRRGDVLAIRVRGGSLLSVQLTTKEGSTSSCSNAGCVGVGVGVPAGDQSRSISFDGTRLNGSGGAAVLTGTLRSGIPGISLPGLPCTSNRYYLSDSSGSVEGYCATPDDFGLGASGQSLPSGATRRKFTFHDGASGPYLEIVTEATAVVSALVYTFDSNTGAATALFQCRGGACPGVTLAPATVDGSLGIDVVLQPIRFDRAALAAVLSDGSLSTSDAVVVDATFIGYFIVDLSTPPLIPVVCEASAPTVLAAPSDQAQAIAVCEPADTQGFSLRSTFIDGDGNTVYSLAGLLADGQGSFNAANSVSLVVASGGAVLSATFDLFNGPRYDCRSGGCAGVSVSAPDPAGERTVTFASTLLQERGTTGLLADRTSLLNGSFIAPPLLP